MSAARFDEGYEHESKRLVLSLCVLLHDTLKSVSLLDQLGVKHTLKYLDSDARREPPRRKQAIHPAGWPLGFVGVRLRVGAETSYFPMLGSDPGMPSGLLPFAEWWGKRLLDSPDGSEPWKRQDFVLGAANKEGGAHVEPEPSAWWTDSGTASGQAQQ